MKVKLLSGNEQGSVVDLPTIEAQLAFDTGFGRPLTKEEEAPEPVVAPKSRKSSKDGD
jgi:hypothetical protein